MNNRSHRNKYHSIGSRRIFVAPASNSASPKSEEHSKQLPTQHKTQDVIEKSPISRPSNARKARSITAVPVKNRQSRSKVLSRKAITKKPIKRKLTLSRIANHAMIGLFVVTNLLLGGYFIAHNYFGYEPGGSMVANLGLHTHDHETEVLGAAATPQIHASTFPVKVTEDKTGSSSSIKIRGINTASQLLYPEDDSYIAWFERSAKPGTVNGRSTLLFTKVSADATNGFAQNVIALQKGDSLTLSLDNNQTQSYSIDAIERVEDNEFRIADLLVSKSRKHPGLTILITTDLAGVKEHMIFYAIQK